MDELRLQLRIISGGYNSYTCSHSSAGRRVDVVQYTHLVVSIASRRRVAGLRLDLEKASIILCDSKREVICDKNDRTSARTCTTVGAVDVDSMAWIMLEF